VLSLRCDADLIDLLGYIESQLASERRADLVDLFNRLVMLEEPLPPAVPGPPGLDISDPALTTTLTMWRERCPDRRIRRKLDLLIPRFHLAQVDASPAVAPLLAQLEKSVFEFEPTVDGSRISRSRQSDLLRRCDDRAIRKVAWLANAALASELEPGLRELIQHRNHAAATLGYRDYPDLILALNEVDPRWLRRQLRRLARLTHESYRTQLQLAALAAGLTLVEPWDFRYLIAHRAAAFEHLFLPEGAVAAAKSLLEGLGVNVDSLGIRTYEAEIPYSALCLSLSVPDDIRIVTSPLSGLSHYRAVFHEFGHALRDVFTEEREFILQAEAEPMDEGSAQVLAHFVGRREWLKHEGVPSGDLPGVSSAAAWEQLGYLRHYLALAETEWAIYRDPSLPTDAVRSRFETRLLGLHPNLGLQFAANALLYTKPMAPAIYLIADAIAARIHTFLEQSALSPISDHRTIPWLSSHFWKSGNFHPWHARVEEATHGPIAVVDLARRAGSATFPSTRATGSSARLAVHSSGRSS